MAPKRSPGSVDFLSEGGSAAPMKGRTMSHYRANLGPTCEGTGQPGETVLGGRTPLVTCPVCKRRIRTFMHAALPPHHDQRHSVKARAAADSKLARRAAALPPMRGGSAPRSVQLVPLTDERRKALVAASNRLGARLEFALSGQPAWTRLDRDGNVTPLSRPYVRFAPPWAEDPKTITDLLGRVDRCLHLSGEFQEVK